MIGEAEEPSGATFEAEVVLETASAKARIVHGLLYLVILAAALAGVELVASLLRHREPHVMLFAALSLSLVLVSAADVQSRARVLQRQVHLKISGGLIYVDDRPRMDVSQARRRFVVGKVGEATRIVLTSGLFVQHRLALRFPSDDAARALLARLGVN